MAVLRAAAMAIVVMVGFSQSSNTGTAGTVVVACACVEVVGAVLEIARTVCLLRQRLQVPGVRHREEHQALCRLKRSPHPCRISIAVL